MWYQFSPLLHHLPSYSPGQVFKTELKMGPSFYTGAKRSNNPDHLRPRQYPPQPASGPQVPCYTALWSGFETHREQPQFGGFYLPTTIPLPCAKFKLPQQKQCPT